jgi:hypothetical protein
MKRTETTPGVRTPVRSSGALRSSVMKISTVGFWPGAKFVTEAILRLNPGRMYVSWSGARKASFWVTSYAPGVASRASGAFEGLVCVTGVIGTATRPASNVRAVRDTRDIMSLLAGRESEKR